MGNQFGYGRGLLRGVGMGIGMGMGISMGYLVSRFEGLGSLYEFCEANEINDTCVFHYEIVRGS